MRCYQTLRTVGAIALLSLLASPSFAANTNIGVEGGCQTTIQCIVNGHIVTGPAAEACNGGHAGPVTQCPRKVAKPKTHKETKPQ